MFTIIDGWLMINARAVVHATDEELNQLQQICEDIRKRIEKERG